MVQYIDKSALVAEIERCCNECLKRAKIVDSEYWNAKADAYRNVLVILDNNLEVKEVDLDKEVESLIKSSIWRFADKEDFLRVVKHFFELGLKASIDKELVEEVYSHIDSIKDTTNRMTSGNFMHNRAAIKFSANTIAKALELMGLKAQKGVELWRKKKNLFY